MRLPGTGTNVPGGEALAHLAEYTSHWTSALFNSPRRALHLPVEETPEFHTNDLAQWANVVSYGATPNNDAGDDTDGIQAAIDSGRPIVYLPCGRYRVSLPISSRRG